MSEQLSPIFKRTEGGLQTVHPSSRMIGQPVRVNSYAARTALKSLRSGSSHTSLASSWAA